MAWFHQHTKRITLKKKKKAEREVILEEAYDKTFKMTFFGTWFKWKYIQDIWQNITTK